MTNYMKLSLNSYLTCDWEASCQDQTKENNPRKDASIQLQPGPQLSIMVLKSHPDRLIFPPDHQGFFMRGTFRTTITPIIAIIYVTGWAPGLNTKNDFIFQSVGNPRNIHDYISEIPHPNMLHIHNITSLLLHTWRGKRRICLLQLH